MLTPPYTHTERKHGGNTGVTSCAGVNALPWPAGGHGMVCAQDRQSCERLCLDALQS